MVRTTAGTAAMNRTVLLPPAARVKSLVGIIPAFLGAGCAMTMWTARTNRTSHQSVAAATPHRRPSVHPARCSAALGNAFTGSGAVTGIQTARTAVTRKTAVSVGLVFYYIIYGWKILHHGNITFCFLHIFSFFNIFQPLYSKCCSKQDVLFCIF